MYLKQKKKHEQDNANLSKVFYIKIISKLLINYSIIIPLLLLK